LLAFIFLLLHRIFFAGFIIISFAKTRYNVFTLQVILHFYLFYYIVFSISLIFFLMESGVFDFYTQKIKMNSRMLVIKLFIVRI